MNYLNNIRLLDECIRNNILHEVKNGEILVYELATKHQEEGWYLRTKEHLATCLCFDPEGFWELVSALKEEGISFKIIHPLAMMEEIPSYYYRFLRMNDIDC